jgi:hypothetical protein
METVWIFGDNDDNKRWIFDKHVQYLPQKEVTIVYIDYQTLLSVGGGFFYTLFSSDFFDKWKTEVKYLFMHNIYPQ